MTDERGGAGRLGERLAAQYLESHGYRVVERNYRCRMGEIDLVVEGPDSLVFVEVRTKRQPCLYRPEETISSAKARRVVALAEHYLAGSGQEERPWRVDVVAVELNQQGTAVRINHFPDAISDMVP